MAWDPFTQPVDNIWLAGHVSPGTAVVSGAGSPRNWPERKGYGLSGAATYYAGRNLATFSVTLSLYTAAEWAHWHIWKPLVDPPPHGQRAKAMKIWHPYTNGLGISDVVVVDCHQPVQMEDGHHEIKIDFKEHRKLQYRLQKTSGTKGPEPKDEREQEIARLQDEVQVEALAFP